MEDPELEEQPDNLSRSGNNTNKRRSLMFSRQSIGLKEIDANLESTSNSVSEEIAPKAKRPRLEEQVERFDLGKYIEQLGLENKMWHKVYAQRKSRTKELTSSERAAEQLRAPGLDLGALAETERAFLKARPDYAGFNRAVFQLHALAVKVTFLNKCAAHYSDKSAAKLQSEVDAITQRIIELAD